MKLTAREITALSNLIHIDLLNKRGAIKDKAIAASMAKWNKTEEGKQYAALPQWMKDCISDFQIQSSRGFEALHKKVEFKFQVYEKTIRSEVTLISRSSKTEKDIEKAIIQKYTKTI